jgi:hypothetical protein
MNSLIQNKIQGKISVIGDSHFRDYEDDCVVRDSAVW